MHRKAEALAPPLSSAHGEGLACPRHLVALEQVLIRQADRVDMLRGMSRQGITRFHT